MYDPLTNHDYFNKVMLDTEVNTNFWPNGADFDPALLYHWEHHILEFTLWAKKLGNTRYLVVHKSLL